MPWLLSPDHPAVLSYARPDQAQANIEYQRFYALGIDAYRIARGPAQGPPRVPAAGWRDRLHHAGPRTALRARAIPAQFVQGETQALTDARPRRLAPSPAPAGPQDCMECRAQASEAEDLALVPPATPGPQLQDAQLHLPSRRDRPRAERRARRWCSSKCGSAAASAFGGAAESITARKRGKIVGNRAAISSLRQRSLPACRFDAVLVDGAAHRVDPGCFR